MTESSWDRLKRIFEEAASKEGAERERHLDEACRGDAALRAEVEALLASHDAMQGASGQTLTGDELPYLATPEAGTVLGRYKLLQQIGEGGFGTVYMAEQQEPVRRKVALKIIKLGMDTKQVVARFEAERQALALMDHPNIAHVLDAGATDTGRPYFVMELVRGIPITEYCHRNKLSTRERLVLFQDVCAAVQHAHQKGIIHRDIKPSNVMVTLHDGRPVPKIIDFGIAKAMNQRLTEKTLFTAYEQFVGTPQYMSPEQAEMSGLDVDTRTDIYALGVLLYELLTGTTPFDARRLRAAGLSEMHRIIREEDPPRPSTRLSTLGASATTTAEHQRTDVSGLQREVRGDLDWIVMKALEKDRTRRFETADSLRMDIQRHLDAEPVLACPPSAAYRFRTFLRRHRTGVAVAGLVLLTLVAGVVLALAGLVEARRERAAARAEADAAAAINEFFSEMLVSVDPQQSARHWALAPRGTVVPARADGLGREISVVDMMLRSRSRVATSFAGKPRLEAVARETIGMVLLGFGLVGPATEELDEAWALRRESLGEGDADTLRSRVQLALALADGDRAADAVSHLQEAVPRMEQLHGPEDARTLSARSVLARALVQNRQHEEATAIFEAILPAQRRVLGDEHPDTLRTMLWWADSLQWRGRGDDAARLTGEVLESCRRSLSPDDALTIDALHGHGWSLNFQGRRHEAEDLLREAVAGFTRLLGPDHPSTAIAKMALGRSLDGPGEQDEKERVWREALASLRKTKGEASPDLYIIRRDLAYLLIARGKEDEGYQLFRDTVRAFEQTYGPGHAWTLDLRKNFADALFGGGRVDEGVRELVRWRGGWQHQDEEGLRAIASWELRMAEGLLSLGREAEAREMARDGLAAYRELAGRTASAGVIADAASALLTCQPPDLRDGDGALALARRGLEQAVAADAPDRSALLDALARAQAALGRPDEALATWREALDLLGHARVADRPELLARVLVSLGEAGRQDEAARLLDDVIRQVRAGSPTPWTDLRLLGNGLRATPALPQAAHVLTAALEDCRASGSCSPASVANILNDLGIALSWQDRHAEALAAYREARDLGRGRGDESSVRSIEANMVSSLAATGELAEAERLARGTLEACRATGGACRNENRALGSVLMQRGDPQAAEPLLRSAAEAARAMALSTDAWRIGRAESAWGECLAALGRFEAAEPLLLRGHEALERARGPEFAATREARERIVALYERWGRPEQLAAWQGAHDSSAVLIDGGR